MAWPLLAVTCFAYLIALAAARPALGHVRRRIWVTGLAIIAVALPAQATRGLSAWMPGPAAAVLPAALLLAAYRTSGLFFERPQIALEQRLFAIDDRWLEATGILPTYRSAPALARNYFELMYLLTYAVAPAGAVVLERAGQTASLDRFWTAVLGAGFASYATLPWIQTRPPRVLRPEPEDASPGAGCVMRRINRLVLDRASIQVNTVPSGHAAVALATALSVQAVPVAGPAFLIVAISIAVATVLGRYHYMVDTLLGAAVALIAWQAAF